MQVTFQHLTGSKAGQSETINADRITIGRNPGSNLLFDPYQDLDVSGEHAQLSMGDDGKLLLTDLNSTNGTFMNGSQVKGPPVLCEPGSKVKFGKNGPECKVDYTPGPAKGGKTRMMLAQVQQDLEKQKEDAASSKKKTVVIAAVVVGVLAIGGGVFAFMSSKSAKRDKAQVSMKALLDTKQQADDNDAAKLVKDVYEAAKALQDNAQAALDAGNFDEAKKLADEGQEQYKQIARLAGVLKAAREKRDEAVDTYYATKFAPDELKRADQLVGDAKKALKGGDSEKARTVALQATEAYKDAIKKANIEIIKEAKRRAEEAAQTALRAEIDRVNQQTEELARKAREDEERRQRELEEARLALERAAAADKAELEAKLKALMVKPPDPSQLILRTIDIAKKKVMLIETKLYVTADGAELELGENRYGTAFLYKDGHVVTAKQTLVPHLFEPGLKGLTELLQQQGRQVSAKYNLYVYDTKADAFKVLFSTERGNLDLGFMAPDVMQQGQVEADVEWSGTMKKMQVLVHEPQQGNLGSLLLKGSHPKGLEPAEKDADLQQLVVAVGTVLDKGVPSPAPVQGNVARRQGDLVEIPTTYEAPRSVAGAPVLNMEAKVVGVVVSVGRANVLYQPLADIDKFIN